MILFLESFDKYGGVNSNSVSVNAMLTAGEWTTATGTGNTIVAGLSATGTALQVSGGSGALTKALPANYGRLIGGLRFSGTLVASAILMQFRDGTNAQCTLLLDTTGAIVLRSGTNAGTILASGGATTANSTHYLEWDITFGATAAYQIWLDGISLFSGTGNTRGGSTNNYSNSISPFVTTGQFTLDDFYLFDATGSTNNAVLLTSPRIETTFPVSDSAAQFAFGAGILGSSIQRTGSATSPLANSLVLRPYVVPVGCTINSIGVSTLTSANCRPVVYADSSGVAGSLMSTGATVTTFVNAITTMPLTTPQSLVAGTRYWIGFMLETGANVNQAEAINGTYKATVTFTSGAPATAPTMTGGSINWLFFGNLTGMTGNNWFQSAQQPPPGQYSYVYDAVVNDEDLYNFAPMVSTPAYVHAVAVKGYVAKSDTGTRTISLRLKSGSTDSGGSNTGQAPGTTFGWLRSHFETDPATGSAWGPSGLNAATSGIKIDS